MMKILAAGAAVASMALIAACGQREAEAELGNTEVEVSTNLPENAVTDQQLEAVAEGAAIAAGTPGGSATGVVVAPPPGNTTGNATAPAP